MPTTLSPPIETVKPVAASQMESPPLSPPIEAAAQKAVTQVENPPEKIPLAEQASPAPVPSQESTSKSGSPTLIGVLLVSVLLAIGAFVYFGPLNKTEDKKASLDGVKKAGKDPSNKNDDQKQQDIKNNVSQALINAMEAQSTWEAASDLWKIEGNQAKKKAADRSFKLAKDFQKQRLFERASKEFELCRGLYQGLSKELQKQVESKTEYCPWTCHGQTKSMATAVG